MRVIGGGAACATPAGMNPFVTLAQDVAVVVSETLVTAHESLEDWMHRMGQALGASLQDALNKAM